MQEIYQYKLPSKFRGYDKLKLNNHVIMTKIFVIIRLFFMKLNIHIYGKYKVFTGTGFALF